MSLIDREKCSGCTACANICPKHCIQMLPDKEGILYPEIEKSQCIECKLCEKVCPVDKTIKNVPLDTYAVKNKNDDIRKRSTSGAMFSVLAMYVLEKKGVVFGCKFNDELEAEHYFAENYEELEQFRGAKYVQSKLNDSFKKVEEFLKQDRFVLFTGTPCQVAGLDSYLGKEYEKLIKCDIVCHSVPSPKALDKYINMLEENFTSKAKEVYFRCKDMYGWKKSNIKVVFKNGKKYEECLYNTPFMKGFNRGLFNRPSCGKCSFKDFKGVSDVTIADYWGIENVDKEFDDNTGVSLVFINSQKGGKILNILKDKIEYIETSVESAIQKNPFVITSSPVHKNRKEFFDRLDSEKFSDLVYELVAEREKIDENRNNNIS